MSAKAYLIGRVGRDPEVRNTTTNKKVVSFSVAVNDRFNKDKTDWFNVSCWGKTADFVEKYIQKGRQVHVDGRLTTRKYTTNDGQNREVTEIIADDVQALDRPTDSQPTTTQAMDDVDPFQDE